MSYRRTVFFVVTLALALTLTACGGGGGGGGILSTNTSLPSYMNQANEQYNETGGVARPGNAIDVYIVYSPESQQYMPRIIEAFNRVSAQGTNPVTGQAWAQDQRPIYVWGQQPTSGSSGSVAQGIINAFVAPGNSNTYHPTIFQPSVSHWLALVNYQTRRQVFDVADARATALTPVVIAIWQSRYEAIRQTLGTDQIGWDDLLAVLESENGWQDFGIANGRRAVFYGHTDPLVSSTGLSTTISEFYACARQSGFTDRRLTLAAVNSPDVQACVREIEALVRHYSRRTEDFLEYFARGPEYLDMLAVEETDLICLNRGAQQGDETCTKPQEQLVAIYPEEGTFWHEHPFGIVNADWVTAEQQAAARIFTDFVLTADMQRIIMSEGFRPANTSVPLEFPFVPENGVDPDQPTTILDVPDPDVIVAIQQSFAVVKKQADILLVIDVSGSMNDNGKIDQARAAALAFLDQMEPTNRVGLALFSSDYQLRIPVDLFETNQQLLRSTVQSMRAEGGTELYYSVAQAVQTINSLEDSDRIRAVVLLSDGQDTGERGATLNDAINAINASRDALNPVIVVPVAYGSNADVNALMAIARAGATNVLSGDPNNITAVLDVIGSFF